tara:strand:- start:274 stop:1074 length:801 start_codon:yes stop_codon:yes gene_type:complete
VSNLSVKEMISAGVHFGHQSKYWNPKMRPFIFTTYKKLHIINLDKSIERFKSASTFIEKLAKNNSKILFVGTKRAAREIIQKHATDVQMPYVNNRWLGGMLTNFDTVKKSIQKLENLQRHLERSKLLEDMTKKETLSVKKQITKLEKNLAGIKHLEKLPDALFVIDTRYEKIAIQEANKLNIPVIAIVDSNNSFDGVDYMIPGNDDSMSSIELFVSEVSKIIKNNKQQTQTKTEQQASSRKSTKKKQIIEVEKDQSNKQPESTKKD